MAQLFLAPETVGGTRSGGDKYSPQFDGLRALAVGSVLFDHLWNVQSIAGHLGVRLFFVLSGFLITEILLRIRSESVGPKAQRQNLAHFYIRRALRTWPAYYALLGAAVIVNFGGIRDAAAWHAVFASNILFSVDPREPGVEVAWWSLAVQEQFFLLWPLLILLTPHKAIAGAVVAVIAAGVAFHFAMNILGITSNLAAYLTPASFDALGAGALLAVARSRRWKMPWLGWLGAASALLAMLLLRIFGPEFWLFETLMVIPMVAVVAAARAGLTGLPGAILEWRPLCYVGRISFGIYLYHGFIYTVLVNQLALPGLDGRGPLLFVVVGVLTVIVATGSWFFLERPANGLKRLFPYPPTRPPIAEIPAVKPEALQSAR